MGGVFLPEQMSLGLGCFRPRGRANELRKANELRDKSPLGKFSVSSCSAMGASDPEIKAGRASREEEGSDSANHSYGQQPLQKTPLRTACALGNNSAGLHCIPHPEILF